MPALGQAALLVSLIVSVWVLFAAGLGAVTRSPGLVKSATRGIVANAALVSIATGVLLLALLTDHFEIRYVAAYSSVEQPLMYKLSALWGGQDGSLMLWCFLLAIFSVIVVFTAGSPTLTDCELGGAAYGILFALIGLIVTVVISRVA